MKNTNKPAAVSTVLVTATLLAVSGATLADSAETSGGIKVKSDDGRFEASVGGRIHFDANILDGDMNAFGATPAGSEMTPNNSEVYLRRVFFTLKGKAYGWNYKIEPDLANNTASGTTNIAFQDITLSTMVGGGELIFGQFKPFRSMEDLTSSNDILLIERPSTSSNGVFNGREFEQGVAYKYAVLDGLLAEATVYGMHNSTGAANSGMGYTGRVAYAPQLAEHALMHVGVSYSFENTQDSPTAAPGTAVNITETFQYAGRRGPTLNLGGTTAGRPVKTFGAELAGQFGPAFFQSEYVESKLGQGNGTVNTPDQKVDAFYFQAAWDITGEMKPYKKADGVFGNVKPLSSYGAFEVVARYDAAKAKSLAACSVTTTVSTVAGIGNKCEGNAITAGLNWYANPNVRFMLNYIRGTADAGAGGKDKPSAYVARAQFAF